MWDTCKLAVWLSIFTKLNKVSCLVLMFIIIVCSIAAFNFSTANCNVSAALLHEKDLFLSCIFSNEFLSYTRDLKASRMNI